MLTITAVECKPTGTASTRLHKAVQYEKAATIPQTPTWNNLEDLDTSDLIRRSDETTEISFTDLAANFGNALPADVSLLSGGLADEFKSITSAMFALSMCDSKIDLVEACKLLATPDVKYNLVQSGYNPDQIQSTVCFCSVYGYDFNTTRQKLYASLYAALIGVLAAGDISTDRRQICDGLDLFNRTGPSLGINIEEYQDLVCNNIPSATPTTPIWYGPTPIVPYVSGNITTWGTPTSWAPNMTISGTGTGPYWPTDTAVSGGGFPVSNSTGNSSTSEPPTSETGTVASDWSLSMNTRSNWTETQPTGTAAASDTRASAWNETFNGNRTPRGRNALAFYPAISTSTSRPGHFKGY